MAKRKGEVVMKCDPFVHVLAHSESLKRCESCLERSCNLKRCTGCQLLRYCSKTCQRFDWNLHKTECPCYRRVAPNTPLDSVRLLFRLIIRYQRGDCEKSWGGDPGWSTVSQLMSHKREISGDERRRTQLSEIVFTLNKMVSGSFSLPSSEEILELFGKMVINTLTIYGGEMEPLGSGLYTSVSKLDHRCQPNVVVVYRGKQLELRAVAGIPDPTPENLFLTYVDQLDLLNVKRRELQQNYYFTCRCDRCQNLNLNQQMLASRCQDKSCDGAVLRREDSASHLCEKCGANQTSYDAETVDKFNNMAEMLVRTSGELSKALDFASLLAHCSQSLEELSRVLHHCNVYVVKLRDRAFQACVELGEWEAAYTHGTRALAGFRLYYPEYNPVVTIEMMKVGKIGLHLRKYDTALIFLQQAEEWMRVTHGREHPLYTDLTELIHQCQEERRAVTER